MPLLKPFLLLCAALYTGGNLPLTVAAQEKPSAPQYATSPLSSKPHPDVQVLLNKANALGEEQKWPEALQGYEAALIKARSLQDRVGEANSLSNIGLAYANMGQEQKSAGVPSAGVASSQSR